MKDLYHYLMRHQAVDEILGKGMFGTVYKAEHIETHVVVALKQIDLTSIEKAKLPGVMVHAIELVSLLV